MRKTKKRALGLPTTNTQDVPTKANQLANFPLNFLRTGNYNYAEGKMVYRTARGFWWSGTNKLTARANDLRTETNVVSPQNDIDRGQGLARRCGIAKIP